MTYDTSQHYRKGVSLKIYPCQKIPEHEPHIYIDSHVTGGDAFLQKMFQSTVVIKDSSPSFMLNVIPLHALKVYYLHMNLMASFQTSYIRVIHWTSKIK
jgi:hypothetical protein